MPIPPKAIKKSGKSNPLGLDKAKPGKSLSGKPAPHSRRDFESHIETPVDANSFPTLVFYLGLQFDLESDIEEVFPAWDIFIRTLQTEAKLQNVLFPYM